ncbi:MAG: aromatic amino acid lyase [Alphaproteobacteria bacterium]|jgi:histidine ammonia-lyase|nr:aromatic amino acid lyase [Rhodospirillaceae bacterium]MBT6508965.1 aromatic amino acid lyase [Rhodospirillaceae bacterium]MBT7648097.1 aromatic amino acid lyase [Rhodospirillaceae bacterium]MDG2479511.1 aromatic amino acid lyase [Alphaproteobacteria bacterium]
MTRVLETRFDLSLDAMRDVAWGGEDVALSGKALDCIAASHASFIEYVTKDPNASVYGVNQGQGEMIGEAMTQADRDRLARLKPLAAAVPFGEPYPVRVTRAMVLARFANLLEGHGMATPRLAEELVAMLNSGSVPRVAQQGQGGPGEILVLYSLFAELTQRLELEAGERGALINGSPAAAAVLADAVLVAERRLAMAEEVMALAIVAFNAPSEHYEPVLGTLLGGTYNTTAFDNLVRLLDGMTDGVEARTHQAPVGYRIAPHVLGQAHAALNHARELAGQSLSAVTHNPVYLPADGDHPHGWCASTGGYHNAVAAPAIDGLAGAWADLCLVCLRLVVGLLNGRASGYPDFLLTGRQAGGSDGHGAVGYLPMAIVGFMEEARDAASRTFIPAADASVFGQDDVTAPAFLAWPKAIRAGVALDRCLAVLATASSQALAVTGRERLPPQLGVLLSEVRGCVKPVEADRPLGGELHNLADHLTVRIMADDLVSAGEVP